MGATLFWTLPHKKRRNFFLDSIWERISLLISSMVLLFSSVVLVCVARINQEAAYNSARTTRAAWN
jgi:hypothetical protein